MIKKNVFEQDLITGMQQQLRKQASGEQPDLVKAGECLHAALEILEEAGLQSTADGVLAILHKIAASDPTRHVQRLPPIEKMMEHGLTLGDMQNFSKGEPGAKIKVNSILRRMGLNEHQIAQFIGKHNMVPEHEIKTYDRFSNWIKDPNLMDPGLVHPGQTAVIESVLPTDQKEKSSKDDAISFNSLAAKPHKPKRPDKIKSDFHTKNLTPEKMIANLKHHGTEFNMADVHSSDFDPELAEALGVNNADDLAFDDMLNIDIGQPSEFENDWKTWKELQGEPLEEDEPFIDPDDTMRETPAAKLFKGDLEDETDADDILMVSEQEPLEDFEDEVHTADDKEEPKESEVSSTEMHTRCAKCGKRHGACTCLKPFPQKRVKR